MKILSIVCEAVVINAEQLLLLLPTTIYYYYYYYSTTTTYYNCFATAAVLLLSRLLLADCILITTTSTTALLNTSTVWLYTPWEFGTAVCKNTKTGPSVPIKLLSGKIRHIVQFAHCHGGECKWGVVLFPILGKTFTN